MARDASTYRGARRNAVRKLANHYDVGITTVWRLQRQAAQRIDGWVFGWHGSYPQPMPVPDWLKERLRELDEARKAREEAFDRAA